MLIITFLSLTCAARSDVIFFPPYAFFAYSGEFIYSLEMICYNEAGVDKWTTSLWAGIGTVGSLVLPSFPTVAGAELAIEKRFYFEPGTYKHFFVSGYAGMAYMGYLNSLNFIGFVPGVKINYKAQLVKNLIMEPYFGISMPVPFSLEDHTILAPWPVATVGLRIGFSTLRRRVEKKV